MSYAGTCPVCSETIRSSTARLCGHCRTLVRHTAFFGFKEDTPEANAYYQDGVLGKSKNGWRYSKWSWIALGCVVVYGMFTGAYDEVPEEEEPVAVASMYEQGGTAGLSHQTDDYPTAVYASDQSYDVQAELAAEIARQRTLQAELREVNSQLLAAQQEAELIASADASEIVSGPGVVDAAEVQASPTLP
ncbi:hypothetical protein KOAAANKH_01694 [Brevundimonas sp. NIBR10]|uniref:hypothetical protein n=1 Tax=Brevundimonas sp. NIBR10 TaxID=3015997 RepID=UPI0022F15989|nr:hypothetical protein [Brevundimonas sp. NIBR10]WGM46820.1 hypothetical protein KOAAANKH_01694 [Brevundimonas sp. NIBR10]